MAGRLPRSAEFATGQQGNKVIWTRILQILVIHLVLGWLLILLIDVPTEDPFWRFEAARRFLLLVFVSHVNTIVVLRRQNVLSPDANILLPPRDAPVFTWLSMFLVYPGLVLLAFYLFVRFGWRESAPEFSGGFSWFSLLRDLLGGMAFERIALLVQAIPRTRS